MSKKRTDYFLMLIIVSGILLLTSCGSGLSPKEYAEWVENEKNGLKITKTEGNYQFTLQYKPVEYIVAMQLRKPEIPDSTLAKEVDAMKDLEYYNFRISTKDGNPVFSGDKLNFPEKEIYLLSGMPKDIFLMEGKDTLKCSLFHFEKSNGIIPYDNCVLAFEKTGEIKKDKTFLYKADKLSLNWIKISIKAEHINKIPKIKTI